MSLQYDRHDFIEESSGDVLFSIDWAHAIIVDMHILYTPLGGSQITYKVERVEVEFEQLSTASQDGAKDYRHTSPVVNVIVSVVP